MIEECIAITKNYPTSLIVGDSQFDKIDFTGGRLDSYLESKYISDKFPIARLNRNGNTWMSITPMELESHITHVLEATGDVLVGGLGMGYYITQIVAKEDVTSVIVIEKDPEVIQAYKALIESNKEYFSNDKLTIIEGDLFKVLPEIKDQFQFNYCYLDIWLDMCFDTISEDFERINDADGINAHKVGFWGMEKYVYDIILANQDSMDTWELMEVIKDELNADFGEVMEWCYKPSIELLIQLDVGQ